MFQELFPNPLFKNNPWGFIKVCVHPLFTCLLLLTLAGLSSITQTANAIPLIKLRISQM